MSSNSILSAASPVTGRSDDHRRRDLHRLAATWRVAAARYIRAEAHSGPDEGTWVSSMLGVEDALAARHPGAWSVLEGVFLDALLTWAHDGAVADANCLTCFRLKDGLPLTSPVLPASWAARP
ncbi:hypothetical protein [Geodermatophilus sp. SYSU D00698]